MILPWQKKQWDTLWQMKTANRLPHALLLSGDAGIGKSKFADCFVHALLCKTVSREGYPCYECQSCRLIKNKSHPNVFRLSPEKTGHAIKVEQLRESIDFIYQSSYQDGYRILMINPAHSMNVNASNALLKTLEEPPHDVCILLLTHQLNQIPATILSRCQRIQFNKPDHLEAFNWLKKQLQNPALDAELLLRITQGAPLAALSIEENAVLMIRQKLYQGLFSLSQKNADPLKIANDLQEFDSLSLIDSYLSWMTDLLKLQLGANHEAIRNSDYLAQLNILKQETTLANNVKQMNLLCQLRSQLMNGINFNKQLMIEKMLCSGSIFSIGIKESSCF